MGEEVRGRTDYHVEEGEEERRCEDVLTITWGRGGGERRCEDVLTITWGRGRGRGHRDRQTKKDF